MANFFQDIADTFKLGKQLFDNAVDRNTQRKVEQELARRTSPQSPTPPKEKIGGGPVNFFSDIAEKYQVKAPLPAKIDNKVPGLKEFASGYRDFSRKLPEATDRTLNLPGDLLQEQIQKRTPEGSIANKYVAPAIGLGINILTPGPGEFSRGKKALTESQAIERIAAETDALQIRKHLTDLNVPKERVKVLAEKLVDVVQPEEVKSIVAREVPDAARAARELETASDLRRSRGAPEGLDKSIDDLVVQAEKTEERTRVLNDTLPRGQRTFLQSLKDSLAPIKATDPETQGTFRKWARENLIGKEKANAELGKIGVRPEEGLDIIHRYERGSPTAYTPKIRQFFDAMHKEAVRRGLSPRYIENYLPHAYKDTPAEIRQIVSKYMERKGVAKEVIEEYLSGSGVLPTSIAKRLKLNPTFAKERVFPTYQAAIEAGLTPRFTNPDQLLAFYRHEMEKAVANRRFVDDLVAKGKLAAADEAPDGWAPVNLEFVPKGYYADPALAKVLNGIFRDEGTLSFGQRLIKGLGATSRKMQEITLSAGLPKSDINFFAIGQLIKEIVSGNVKAIPAFIRANSSARTIKYFTDNAPVLRKMAEQGIDVGARTGEYSKLYNGLIDQRATGKKIAEALGRGWDQAFNKVTFSSFMPQLQVQSFKDALGKGIRKGMTAQEAEKFAGDVVRNAFGLLDDVGRGRGTEDALAALFFAPKFREGIIRTLANTGRSVTTEALNPAFYRNRRLFSGLVFTYGMYNLANKELTGHYMWENPPGKEFDLMIPLNNGDNVFIGYMPSFFAFARNMGSGALALARGDVSTAKQKFGSLLSMPLTIFTELWANRDYFGREIYKDTDDGLTKAKKMAAYVGLEVNHPFIRETIRQITTEKPLYQSISEGLELPLKFQSEDQISRNLFYRAMDKQEQTRADARKRVQPTYNEVQKLKAAGKTDEAQAIVDNLSDEDYEIYKGLRATDKRKATMRGQSEIFDLVLQVNDLKAQGKTTEAQAIVDSFSEEEYRLYKLAKKKAP